MSYTDYADDTTGNTLYAKPEPLTSSPSWGADKVSGTENGSTGSYAFTLDSFLDWWWMKVDEVRLNQINAKMPPHTIASPRMDAQGNGFLCADLFSDAVVPDARLEEVLPLLLDLTLQYLPADYWPKNDEIP